MNYNQIKKDFQEMTTDTQKLVDKYNKSVQSIKSQELAIEKLKNKLDELTKGNKTPTSIKNIQIELKKSEQEVSKLEKEYEDAITKMESLKIDLDWAKSTNNKNDQIKVSGDIKSLDAEMLDIATRLENARDKSEQLETNLKNMKLNPDSIPEVQELNSKIDLSNSKLQESKENASNLKDEIKESMNSQSVNLFGGKIDEVGNKIDKFKTRLSRLVGTAMIFNLLRNQLTSLRNNFISLLKTDNQFSNSLNQIKANLMTAFAPIYNACLPAINSLMNSLNKITGTIAVFVANLFGTSIKDATKDAKKLSGALNKTASSAKKASGSLASFDTLEVIPEESSGGGSIGTNASEINYSGEITYSERLLKILNRIKDLVVETWEWLTKNKEEVRTVALIVAGIHLASKIISYISSLGTLAKMMKTISKLFVKVGDDGTKSFNKVGTGVTIAIAGFILMIKNVTDLINNWDKLSKKQKLIKSGMAVLGAAAIALGIAIATGISTATLGIGAIIALIATAITAIISFIAKLVKEKDAILSVKDAQEKLNKAHEEYVNATNNYVSAVDKADEALKNLQEAENQTGLSGEALYKSVQNGTLDYANMTEAQKKVYKAYLENKSAQDELKKSSDDLTSAKKVETDASFANQLAIAAESGNYDEYKKSVIEAYENGTLSAEDARDKLEQAMSRMSKKTQKTFTEDIPNNIKEGMDPQKYQTTWQKFKYGFIDICGKIGDFFSKLFNKTIPKVIDYLAEKLKKFFKKTLPNLAISGIEILINRIISAFEKLFNIPINSINRLIKKANKKIPTVNLPVFDNVALNRVTIPRLARGTVIPPRQEFMAILGDQKHGTNIEAPLETIKQANREVLEEVLGRIGISGQNREIVLKNWQFILQFGNTKLGKIIIEEIKKYEKETNTQFLLA